MIRHVWAESETQPTMPNAGNHPPEGATFREKRDWYVKNLGAFFVNGETGVETATIGLRPKQDGQDFAAHWKDNMQSLEAMMKNGGWDQWMKIDKMASGVTTFPEVIKKIGVVISTTRANLNLNAHDITPSQTALFTMAEAAGTTVENLRVEDNEKFRTGGKPTNVLPGKGAIADRLKATPEFMAALTEDERKNFAVETKSSEISSKKNTGPWRVFDSVATKEKWGSRVSNIEDVIKRVSDAYKLEVTPNEHYTQIDAIQETNRKIKNWNAAAIGFCTL